MSIRYKPYAEYKASGVEWLGDVPSLWDVSRLGKHFDERREKVSDKDFEPLSVTMKGIVPRLETAAKTDAGDNRKKVCIGDFVINSRSDRKGSSGVSPLNGSVSLISIVLAPRQIEGVFIHHLLRSQPFQEEFYRYGKGIVADLWSTNYSEMKNILLPTPSLPEQCAIASFLDRETGKIDRMIGKQERMIELLKEKRQAVISHAVTKGLDPNVPMKDSGIEWLGEIPEHWMICQLRRTIKKLEQGWSPVAENRAIEEGECGVIKLSAIKKGLFSPHEAKALPAGISFDPRLKIHNGNVLFTRGNTPDLVGDACFVEGLTDECLLFSDLVYRIYCLSEIDPHYLTMWLISSVGRFPIKCDARGTSMTMAKISQEHIKGWPFIFPSRGEQQEIVLHLKKSTSQIDHLMAKAKLAIELMKERRTALISAAVTGKIDVRAAV